MERAGSRPTNSSFRTRSRPCARGGCVERVPVGLRLGRDARSGGSGRCCRGCRRRHAAATDELEPTWADKFFSRISRLSSRCTPQKFVRGRRKGCEARGEIVGGVRRVCGEGARPRDEDTGDAPEDAFGFWDDEHKNARLRRGLVLGSPGVTAARCGPRRVSRRRGARRRARGRWRRSVSVFLGV